MIGLPADPDPMALVGAAMVERDEVIIEVMEERMSGVPLAALLEVELKQRLAVAVAWGGREGKGMNCRWLGGCRRREMGGRIKQTYHSRHLASTQSGNSLHDCILEVVRRMGLGTG